MTQGLVTRSEKRNYSDLFRLDLNWGAPDLAPITLELDGESYTATNVSTYQGLRVWEIPCLPGSAVEAKLDQRLAKKTTNRLVIFHDQEKQAWRWPSRTTRDGSVSSRPSRHVHRTGSKDPQFAAKLDAISLPDDIVLDANAVLAKVRGAFDVETKNETKRASKLMARMYTAVERTYPSSYDPRTRDHEISVSLARILFLLFGDDTEMWATELFQDYIKDHTKRDGSDIGPRLNTLFEVLDTAPTSRGVAAELAAFPYVNGRIFEERITLPDLEKDFRDAVLDAAAVDWSTISPAIFGSMFQSVRDAQTRRELGEHYTSEENILKTLNPLFLDELRADFDAALQRDTDKKKANALNALWTRLGDIRYMDPACGCGNFIIVAYRELRAIELDIMLALQDLSGYSQLSFDPTLDLKITLDHFYGIEIDEWPARIAETAMFLIDRQCDLRLKERFGEAPQRLPIQREASIVVGDALKLDWAEVLQRSPDVIIAGNPPFLGISLRSAEQTAALKTVWGGRYHGTLDYVTGWHACAMKYFARCDGRWALVSTNSIMQGEATAPLFKPIFEEGWRIKFGHRTFKWTSEASGQAAVHCVIMGFEREPNIVRLFDYLRADAQPVEVAGVKSISPYLTDGPTVIVEPVSRPLNSQLGEVAYGNKPTDGGWLIVDPDEREEVAGDPIAAKYLRRYVGARELLHGDERYCLWLTEATPADLRRSRVLRERVAGVREFRLDSKAASTRAAAGTAHLFRQLAQPSTAYLCIPAHVSETRPYFLAARLAPDVITSNANFLTPDPDGFEFAIISSAMFITWQKTVGGRLESRLRFNKLLTWNTFPLPSVSPGAKLAILAAGRQVLEARELQSGTPLADMYPATGLAADLQRAHLNLDQAVDEAFGIDGEQRLSELDRQDLLFQRYSEMTAESSAHSARSGHR
jgi:hypothetical protein